MGLTGALGTTLASRARADETQLSFFPLEAPRSWHYKLTLEIEGVPSNAEDERTIVQKVKYREHDAFITQDKISFVEAAHGAGPALESNVLTTETLALEGNKVLVLSEQHAGAAEHVCDPPRVFLDLSFVEGDAVGQVWSWTSTDGRESLTGKILEKGPFVDRHDKIHHGVSVLLTSTFKGEGRLVATEERKLWLVRGQGIYKEHVVVSPPGSHKTITDLELEGSHEVPNTPTATPTPK